MSTYRDELLAMAGRRLKRARALRKPPPAPDPVPTLDDVAFASPQARELAESLGLRFRDFAGSTVIPSGVNGYVSDDVRNVHAEVSADADV